MLSAIALLLAGLLVLVAGGESLVRGSVSLGTHFGLSPLVAGLTIVAFGTSAPELAVSLQASLGGVVGLAVGNVIGSNICNIALILGLTAVVRPPQVEAKLVRWDVPLMIACAALLVLMLVDGEIVRVEGALLTAGLVAYVSFTVIAARSARSRVTREFADALPSAPHSLAVSGLLIGVGLAALVFGSDLFVRGGASLAAIFGVPPAIIGLSIVAIGTSLPEIATSLVAAVRGHADMAVGNVVGSNIFNVLGVLGVTGLVTPVARGAVTAVDLGVMIFVSLLLLPIMFTRARIDRWEGALMVAVYAGYMAWLLPGAAAA